METIYKLGGGAFKSFMCRCSNYPQTDDGTIIEGLKILSRLGALHAVHAEDMYYLNKHTLYDGAVFKGYVSDVYIRGTLICHDGKIQAEPGFGKYRPMQI